MTDKDEARLKKKAMDNRQALINLRHTMPYKQRLEFARANIRISLISSHNPRVAVSGGIDSAVLLHMVRQVQPVRAVWINTGIEYPETCEYLQDVQDLDVITPKRTYWKIADEFGFPEESRKNKQPACCRWLKEYPMRDFVKEENIDLVFTGLIGSEGQHRRYNYILRSDYYKHAAWNVMKSTPLILFRKQEIWRYASENEIPANPAYEKYDIQRIGCMACTGFKGWRTQMEKTSPRLLNLITHWPTFQPGGGLPKQ